MILLDARLNCAPMLPFRIPATGMPAKPAIRDRSWDKATTSLLRFLLQACNK
jgi:hypothetical protein